MGHDGLDPQSYPLKLKAYMLWLNDEKIISIFQKNPACCYGKRNSNKLNVLHVKKLWFLMWYDVGNDKKVWNLIFSRINSSHDLSLSSKIRNKHLEKQKVKQKVQLKLQQTAHNTCYIIHVRNTLDDTRLKLAKNQVKPNQHLETELLLSWNYLPRYHP